MAYSVFEWRILCTVACLLKARTVKPAETAVARQWLSSHNVMATTDMHTTMEELLEAVFAVRSVPKLYNKDQLPLRVSRETVCRRQAVSWELQ
jgi:hypothetical protein